jgi:HlyD family secretion protein
MSAHLDLQQLVVDRGKPAGGNAGRPRRLISRYVLPLAIVVGFLLLVGWAARDSFLPSKSVTVVPVIVTAADVHQAGAVLFRGAGWIEPRPTPTVVTALAEGVVDRLFVNEGEAVEAGQELARLVDTDARIALGQAEAELQLREADLTSAQGTLKAAIANLEQPIQLKVALAEVESKHAKVKRELVNLPFALRSEKARLDLAKQDFEGKSSAGAAVSGRVLQRAKSELAQATAAVEELEARESTLADELAALERQREATETQLKLKTEEHRRLNEAEAAVRSAEARCSQATFAVEAAKLRLERMVIRSPITGRVLALSSQPGKRLMGLLVSSLNDASTLLTLYDPHMLQVRADVRLEDVPHIEPGQPVRIETPAAPDGLDGEVIAATSLTDLQKNTLQVKVAIKNPPAVIKPDMLVQVTFLEPARADNREQPTSEPQRLLIPKPLVETSAQGDFVWLADRVNQVARWQPIKLGRGTKGELVEVVEGLSAMDKLIVAGREGLQPDQRINVVGEDNSLGTVAEARK